MRKRLVLVVGWPHSGKSTVIQSLTGAKTKSFIGPVQDKSTGKSMHVVARSPQEAAMRLSRVLQILHQSRALRSSLGVVMAIQPRPPFRQNSMENILRAARRMGFKPHAFILNPSYSFPNVAPDPRIEERVRKARVPVQTLDARRFAHQNAAIIRDTVGLF